MWLGSSSPTLSGLQSSRLSNLPHPSSRWARSLSRKKREGQEGWYLTQKQSREKCLLSNPLLLIIVQVLSLPILLINKIRCKNSQVNYRTGDWGEAQDYCWWCPTNIRSKYIALTCNCSHLQLPSYQFKRIRWIIMHDNFIPQFTAWQILPSCCP